MFKILIFSVYLVAADYPFVSSYFDYTVIAEYPSIMYQPHMVNLRNIFLFK